MAAPSALTLYDAFKQYVGDGTIDLDTDTIKVALVSSAYTPSSAHSVLADITNEVANGNGYTTGGVTLTSLSYTQTSGTAKFTSSNPSWTGASAGFVARRAIFYKSGTANAKVNPLIGHMLLDSAPADVSFAPGNTVTITMNAGGWLTNT